MSHNKNRIAEYKLSIDERTLPFLYTVEHERIEGFKGHVCFVDLFLLF